MAIIEVKLGSKQLEWLRNNVPAFKTLEQAKLKAQETKEQSRRMCYTEEQLSNTVMPQPEANVQQTKQVKS